MFLNIAMGLVLIGTCATILKSFSGLSSGVVVAVMMACGIANGAGRLVFPVATDFMKSRLAIWKIILRLEVLALAAAWAFPALMPIAAILINSCYGAAFATLPSVLNDHYGKEHLSEVHGFVLSAWGFASLFAYGVTLFGVSLLPFTWLLVVLAVVYAVNYLVVRSIKL
jgi:OFA family oxalate/formate antiporter-like MFS transporter